MAGALVLGASVPVFAAEEKEKGFSILESVPLDMKGEIIKQIINKESNFEDAVKTLNALKLRNENLDQSITALTPTLSSYIFEKFFNNDEKKATKQLLHLSYSGVLNPFILELLIARIKNPTERINFLNSQDEDGNAALIGAAAGGYIDIVKMLIKKGVDLNIKDTEEGTALSYASFTKLPNVEKGNRRREIAKELILAGANLDGQDSSGYTALMWAVGVGDIEIAKLLIEKGANLNIQDRNGDTALDQARKYNRTDIAKMIENAGAKE